MIVLIQTKSDFYTIYPTIQPTSSRANKISDFAEKQWYESIFGFEIIVQTSDKTCTRLLSVALIRRLALVLFIQGKKLRVALHLITFQNFWDFAIIRQYSYEIYFVMQCKQTSFCARFGFSLQTVDTQHKQLILPSSAPTPIGGWVSLISSQPIHPSTHPPDK